MHTNGEIMFNVLKYVHFLELILLCPDQYIHSFLIKKVIAAFYKQHSFSFHMTTIAYDNKENLRKNGPMRLSETNPVKIFLLVTLS